MKNSYLITGGTGSFGSAFVKKLLTSKIKIQRLVIFSRDELKQSVMEEKYPKKIATLQVYKFDIWSKERKEPITYNNFLFLK